MLNLHSHICIFLNPKVGLVCSYKLYMSQNKKTNKIHIIAHMFIHIHTHLTGGRQFSLKFVNLLIMFGITRNCFSRGRIQSLYLFISRVVKQTVVITEAHHFLNCNQHELIWITGNNQKQFQRKIIVYDVHLTTMHMNS